MNRYLIVYTINCAIILYSFIQLVIFEKLTIFIIVLSNKSKYYYTY